METKEFALVLFTVLSQASVGAFILLSWLRLRNRSEAMDAVYRRSIAVLLPIMAVALVASLFHLGRPMLAFTSLRRLATSWLSREIFFSGAFFALLAATVLLEKSAPARKALSALTALAGAVAVFSMGAVYTATVIPAWQGWGTYAAFVGTTVLAGAGLAAGLVAFFGRSVAEAAGDLQQLVGAAIAALILGLVAYPLYLASLGNGGAEAQASLQLLGGPFAGWLALRWALTLAGGAVPLLIAWRRLSAGQKTSGLVYAALVCMVAGELVGRYLFYATGVPMSIG
ncbi:dimethyl sulfoxide reductase anchor subunit family protein [Symbiobacterium thermophilum]|uniref:dimethyl sulfoxide reductase anchor subunit family protein n=1 Tax=Symbiobacterium thermophilum TaxID=2734 RepID=UPI0035C69667